MLLRLANDPVCQKCWSKTALLIYYRWVQWNRHWMVWKSNNESTCCSRACWRRENARERERERGEHYGAGAHHRARRWRRAARRGSWRAKSRRAERRAPWTAACSHPPERAHHVGCDVRVQFTNTYEQVEPGERTTEWDIATIGVGFGSYAVLRKTHLMCRWNGMGAPDRGGRRAERRARSPRRGTSPPDSAEAQVRK